MAASNSAAGPQGPVAAVVHKATGGLIAIAVVFIILGVLAIGEPMVAGLAVAALVGWLLIAGGVAHAVSAFGGGVYFFTHSVVALGTLTLFLAGILVGEAILELFAYFQMRGTDGAGWLSRSSSAG